MNRKEILQQNYDARVAKTHLESALPPNMPHRRISTGVVWTRIVVSLVAGVACWLFYGGHLP